MLALALLILVLLAAMLYVGVKLENIEGATMAISAALQALIEKLKVWVVTLRDARDTIAALRAENATLRDQVAAGGLPATEEGKSAAEEAADAAEVESALGAVISEVEAAGAGPATPPA